MRRPILILILLAALGWAGATASAQTPIEIPPDWGFTAAVYYEAATDTSNRVVTVNNRFSLTASWAESLRNGKTYFPSVGIEITINQGAFRPNSITFRSNSKAAPRPHKEWPPESTCAGDSNAQWWTMPIGVVLDSSWEDGGYSYWRYKSQWDNVQPLRNMAQFSFRIPMRGCHNSTNPKSYTLDWEIYEVDGQPLLMADFDAQPQVGEEPLDVLFTDLSIPRDSIVNWRWEFGDGTNPVEYQNYYEKVAHMYDAPGVYTVSLTVTDGQGRTDTATQSVTVYANKEMLRPLRQEQTSAWGIWDYRDITINHPEYIDEVLAFNPVSAVVDVWYMMQYVANRVSLADSYMVNAFANVADADVYAVRAGEVISVKAWERNDDCISTVNPYLPAITGGLLASLDDSVIRCLARVPHVLVSGDDDLIYTVNWQGGATVIVRGFDNLLYEYAVRAPAVEVGDRLSANCLLGKTLQLATKTRLELESISVGTGADGSFGLQSYETDNGYTAVIARRASESQSIFSQMAQWPTGSTPCGEGMANTCISRNNNFREGGGVWSASGDVRWLPGSGVILGPSASLNQYLYLEPDQQHTVSLQGQLEQGGAGSLAVKLGDSYETISIDQAEWAYQHTATFTADMGRAYHYSLYNSGSTPITLLMQCVSTDAIELDRGPCYFTNSSFDYGMTGWATSPTGVQAFGGGVGLEDGATISQNVDLRPGTYTLTATVRYMNEQRMSISTLQPRLNYSLNGSAWQSMVLATKQTIDYVPVAAQKTDVQMTAEIVIAEQTTGALALLFDRNSSPAELEGLIILEVCLTGVDRPYDNGGGPVCRVITPPLNDEPSSWLTWLWDEFDNFFQCDLMVMLNRIYTTLDDLRKLIGWQARYWMAVLMMQQGWFVAQLLPWLGGHFNNMAGGGAVTVQAGTNLWDVLVALINALAAPLAAIVDLLIGIVTQAVNLLLALIVGVIGVALSLIGRLFELIWWLLSLMGGLIGAYNNTPATPIPGLPDCNNTTSSVICVGVWFMEHTFFSTTVGKLIIPLVIGLGSWTLIEWIVDQIRGTLSEAGGNS